MHAELGKLLCARFDEFSDLSALWLDGREISYRQLFSDAARLADILFKTTAPGDRLGLLAQRSYPAYAGILASILAGRPYVPLNMKFPFERQLSIATIAGCKIIISDTYSKRRAGELLAKLGPDVQELSLMPAGGVSAPNFSDSRFEGHESELAYIMFTSGTTGIPKGVAVRRDNLFSYLAAIAQVAPV